MAVLSPSIPKNDRFVYIGLWHSVFKKNLGLLDLMSGWGNLEEEL